MIDERSRRGLRRWLLRLVSLGALFAGSFTLPLQAQQNAKLNDTLRRIFATGEFAGKHFGPARWLKSGATYVTVEPSAAVKDASDIVRYDAATGKREVLVSASQLIPSGDKAPLKIEDYALSDDMNRLLIFTNSTRVWRRATEGDFWLLDRETGALKKLGGGAPPSSLQFAKLSPDGSRAAYVRERNIYSEDLKTGKITQLTRDGSDAIINGTSDWVYEEEFDIRDAFRWSPDGRRIAYWQFNDDGVKDYPLVYDTGGPHHVITGIPYPQYGVYPTIQHYGYPEAGTTNPAARVGAVSADGGETQWMNVPGDPRENYIARMEWAGNSDEIVMEHLNRLQNTNDVLLANAATGAVRQLYHDQDAAWLDVVDELRWAHGGKDLLWESERDGWRHVYLISRESGEARLVTHGDFDVVSVAGVDEHEEWLYFIASPDDATARYLYRTRLDGTGSAVRVTPAGEPAIHSYQMEPGCAWAFHTDMTFDQPSATDLIKLPDHASVRVLEPNSKLRAKVQPFVASPTEFFQLDIGGGVNVDAWMIKPEGFDPTKKYPLLVHIYGEPAGQTTLRAWGEDGVLFHRALANEGYLIASFDNRGTPAPKGRAWRKAVYGSIGVLSSQDQAAALPALERTRPYVDPSRVAVWGWSGGGTNTLNLMFRSPDLYQVGMAVAPVPDQRLYDSIYQERYMGLPQQNVEGYRSGSAINFANGLRGRLLIVHGSGDDNVHFEGTELLVNRLIELGKSFDFMVYPGRTHSISEGAGTTLHIYSLLARYLEEHLPAGPR
ncbi:MAG TPA: S9 family peptidase [Terriglobia bacterium]|nr:S9 family peptidase [Terriglobia bacterium]